MAYIDWLNFWARKIGGFGHPKGVVLDMTAVAAELEDQNEARQFADTAARALGGKRGGGGGRRDYEATESRSNLDPSTAGLGGMGAPDNPVRDVAKRVAGQVGKARKKAGEKAGDVLETADEYVFEPIKRVGTSISLLPGEGLRRAAEGEDFDLGEQIGDAWDRSNDISFAQSQIMNLRQLGAMAPSLVGKEYDARIFTEQGFENMLEESKNDWRFNVVTGIGDAAYSLVADPLIGGGKALSVARKALSIRPVKAGEDITKAVADPRSGISKRVSSLWSDKTKGWGANDFLLASDGIRNSANPMAHAAALAEMNAIKDPKQRIEMMKLVERVALGDQSALAELRQKRAAVTDMLEEASRFSDDGIEAVKHEQLSLLGDDLAPVRYDDVAGVRALHEERMATIRDEATKALDEAVDYLGFMERDIFGTARTSVPRVTAKGETKVAAEHGELASMFTYRRSFWSPPVAALHIAGKPLQAVQRMRANGFVDYHAPDSYKEIDSFLHGVRNISPDARAGHLNEYVKATTEFEKRVVVERIERQAVASAAREKGITPETAEQLYKKYMDDKKALWGTLQSRAYSAAKDESGKTVDTLSFVDEGVEYQLRTPLGPDQLANIDPMIDLDRFYKVLDKYAPEIKAAEDWISSPKFKGEPGRVIADYVNKVNSGWKMFTLLRGGYPIRNAIEGNARTWAKSHTAATAMWAEGSRNVMSNLFRRGNAGAEAARRLEADINRMDALADRMDILRSAADDSITDGANLDELTLEFEKLSERVNRLRKSKPADIIKEYGVTPKPGEKRSLMTEPIRLVDGTVMTLDTELAELANTKGFAGRMMREIQSDPASLHRAAENQSRRLEGLAKERFEFNWGRSRTILPEEGDVHTRAWLHAVNNQIGNNPIAMKLLAGENPAKIVSWLRRDPDGRDIIRRMPQWRNALEDLVRRNQIHVDTYVPSALRELRTQRKLSAKDIGFFLKNGGVAPPVHGADLAAHGAGAGGAEVGRLLGRALEFIADPVENRLTRHPHYVMMYRQRAKMEAEGLIRDPNRAALNKGNVLDAEDMTHIKRRSHEYALKSLRENIYDASRRSNAAYLLKWISPFFASHQDSMSRWWDLAKESPDILGYFNQLTQMPTKVGVVIDADGELVKDRRVRQDDQLLFAIPGWLSGDISEKDYEDSLITILGAQQSISIGTFNVLMPGDPWWSPGTGPMAQVPLSAIRKAKPEWNDALKILDPYGPSDGVTDSFAPSTVKRAISLFQGMDDEDFARTFTWMHQQDLAEWVKGGRVGAKPTPKEAEERTRALYVLRVLNNGGNPFPVRYASKHQFARDAYERLEQRARDEGKDYDWVDEQFVKNYDPALKILAAGTTRNNAGLAPTAEAMLAKKEYQALIDLHPELTKSIVGQAGQVGEFNESAWEAQMSGYVTPGGKKIRERKQPADIARDSLVSVGFDDYRREMDMIDAMADDRGLSSYKEDPMLVALRKAAIAKIGADNSDWLEEFSVFTTPGAFDATLSRIEKVVKDKSWSTRPERTDIPKLKDYLELRKTFQILLAGRVAAGGASTMDAQSNADLRALYVYGVNQFNQDTQFSRNWFNGLLEKDPMLGDFEVPTAGAK